MVTNMLAHQILVEFIREESSVPPWTVSFLSVSFGRLAAMERQINCIIYKNNHSHYNSSSKYHSSETLFFSCGMCCRNLKSELIFKTNSYEQIYYLSQFFLRFFSDTGTNR